MLMNDKVTTMRMVVSMIEPPKVVYGNARDFRCCWSRASFMTTGKELQVVINFSLASLYIGSKRRLPLSWPVDYICLVRWLDNGLA